MKTNDQQIAITKALGWEFCERPNPRGYMHTFCRHPHLTVGGAFRRPLWKRMSHLPYYPNDLNAMHEAETWLISKATRAMRYEEKLIDVCSHSHPPATQMGSLWHATAAQRAEAFLRTLNLWTD